MSHSEGPISPIPLKQAPYHQPLPSTLIIEVLALKISLLRPIKLPFSTQLILLPFPSICFAIRPHIGSMASHLAVYEIPDIIFTKNSPMGSLDVETNIK